MRCGSKTLRNTSAISHMLTVWWDWGRAADGKGCDWGGAAAGTAGGGLGAFCSASPRSRKRLDNPRASPHAPRLSRRSEPRRRLDARRGVSSAAPIEKRAASTSSAAPGHGPAGVEGGDVGAEADEGECAGGMSLSSISSAKGTSARLRIPCAVPTATPGAGPPQLVCVPRAAPSDRSNGIGGVEGASVDIRRVEVEQRARAFLLPFRADPARGLPPAPKLNDVASRDACEEATDPCRPSGGVTKASDPSASVDEPVHDDACGTTRGVE